jgi:hypothetical protein
VTYRVKRGDKSPRICTKCLLETDDILYALLKAEGEAQEHIDYDVLGAILFIEKIGSGEVTYAEEEL